VTPTREFPELLRWSASVEKTGTPDVSVIVTTSAGERWPIASDELRQQIEKRSGRRVFLLRDYCGSFDVAAVSLISVQTIQHLAEETGVAANPWRFRSNLLVDIQHGAADDELKWVGRVLRIGETARIAVTEVDERCVMTTTDPENLDSNPQVLRCIVQHDNKCAGVYATVLTPGLVYEGDTLSLEDSSRHFSGPSARPGRGDRASIIGQWAIRPSPLQLRLIRRKTRASRLKSAILASTSSRWRRVMRSTLEQL
jgi:hypothetical protein